MRLVICTNIKESIFIVNVLKYIFATHRKKRDLADSNNTKAEGNYTASIVSFDTTQLSYINETAVDSKGLLFHTLNISVADTAVRVTFIPEENTTFELYYSVGAAPYPDTHSLWRTVSRNVSDDIDMDAVWADNRYTTFIPAANLSLGTLYVGIYRTGIVYILVILNTNACIMCHVGVIC